MRVTEVAVAVMRVPSVTGLKLASVLYFTSKEVPSEVQLSAAVEAVIVPTVSAVGFTQAG